MTTIPLRLLRQPCGSLRTARTIADLERDSLALFAGMMAEREERLALAPRDGRSAAEVLADLSAAIDRVEARP